MDELEKEYEFIEGLFSNYIKSNDSKFLRFQRELDIKMALPFMENADTAYGLELGCEVGYMTSLIADHVKHLDVVEGSPSFIQEAEKLSLPNVTFHNMLFEELTVVERYDYVFASHVIEHVESPQHVLARVFESLKPGGRLFVFVPNAEAASRRLAVKMGLLDDLYALTPNDLRGGHRRVYNRRSIAREVSEAGFKVIANDGLFFKSFADFQFEELISSGFLTVEHLNGLAALGSEFPDLCGYAFICGEKK